MKQCEVIAQNILNNVYTPISDYTERSPKKEFALNERETIEKSHIAEHFSNSMKISKKGFAIKEKLQASLQEESESISGLSNKLTELKIKIGEEPTLQAKTYSSWLIDGFEDKISDTPLFYEINYNIGESIEYVGENKPEDVRHLKDEYNNTANKLIQCKIEVVMINTMINNFDDKKSYDLDVRQAAILGF